MTPEVPPPPKTPTVIFPPEPGSKVTIPPDKRGASYFLALSLATSAAASAAGIGNPVLRTGAIIIILGLVYLIGLRTQ